MRARGLVAGVLLAGLVAACARPGGPPAATDDPPAATSAPTSDPTTSPSPGPAVPEILDFGAPLVGGGRLEGADYAGRELALWFWAPW
jgi:hypothetical protein